MSGAAVAAVAGAGGGILAQVVTYPLQTVNTRQQTERKLLRLPDADVTPSEASKTTLQQFIKIINEEGPSSLYQGLGSSIVGTALSQGIYYGVYQMGRDWATNKNKKSIGTLTSLAVAALSGCVNVLLTTPIWVVVTRLQTEKQARKAKLRRLSEAAGRYELETGVRDRSFVEKPVTTAGAVAEMYKEAGLLGFWKGVLPALIMVSNPAIQFMIYEALLERLTAKRRLNKAGFKNISASEVFMLGSVAKLGATLVTYPLLVIKSRLQAKQDIGTDDSLQYTGTLDAVAKMVKHEGFLSFYKGMDLKIVQSVLAAAILFMTKEELVKLAFVLLRSNKGRKLPA
ncbi:peroxisomal membrane protein [Klebsormidium nitens]|uniref:Peroxisomal membrane protein n=1 Tax=Klebsormidium nitens TaxID=105231 RepID=A0A1Y1I350_KLENI|nr:peroxisomal membrane protein [Klebsormidium nitens]|eukprot:GAQ84382.1 peroxisomal membrane protein [Klebsormidium nitens]